MTLEVPEGLLYFLKYPLLALLYLFLATALHSMARTLPTPTELETCPGAPVLPAPEVRPARSAQATPARPAREGGWLEVVTGMEAPPGGFPVQGPLLFGRSEDCSVPIPDPFVSSHHARLVPGPEGVVLEDLGSRNGTWLGPVRLEGPISLKEGDHFAVGDVTFRYHRA